MFLKSSNKNECYACEACIQVCKEGAISLEEDEEGFRYPFVDFNKCINCKRCENVCPYEKKPRKHTKEKTAFGGYHLNPEIRFESTSGGAFSAIVDAFCIDNYVIFGAEANGLSVFHSYITDKKEISKFRKSKYSQSVIGVSYQQASIFLKEGKKVLFSGTPCQIAGLLSFLGNQNIENLLTVEVICEGIPSPLYIRKLDDKIKRIYGYSIDILDYRYTGKSLFSKGKWDFQDMYIGFGENERKEIIIDRWFNPFWFIWLSHLMSRPSCYNCSFATKDRISDITLGDLWGVHLYCPELYGNNGGASLVICSTEKGETVFSKAQCKMYGHELKIEDAIKYQSPMRKSISNNPNRSLFMKDLASNMDYNSINRKWAKRPSIKLLYQKYIWGNRQKVFFWNLKKTLTTKRSM